MAHPPGSLLETSQAVINGLARLLPYLCILLVLLVGLLSLRAGARGDSPHRSRLVTVPWTIMSLVILVRRYDVSHHGDFEMQSV